MNSPLNQLPVATAESTLIFSITLQREAGTRAGQLVIYHDRFSLNLKNRMGWNPPHWIFIRDVLSTELDKTQLTIHFRRSNGAIDQQTIIAGNDADAAKVFSLLPHLVIAHENPSELPASLLLQATDRDPAFKHYRNYSPSATAYSDEENTANLNKAVWEGGIPLIVTPLLVVTNIGVFIWMGRHGAGWTVPNNRVVIDWGANYWPLTTQGQWWRLLTCAFVHFGSEHLVMNMISLAMLGICSEWLFGKRFFLLIYIYGALVSSLVDIDWHHNSVDGGASGAIFALLGANAAFLLTRSTSLSLKATADIFSYVFYYFISLLLGFFNPEVSNAAHMGGLVSGFVLGIVLSRTMEPTLRRHQFLPRLAIGLLFASSTVALGIFAVPKSDGAVPVQHSFSR